MDRLKVLIADDNKANQLIAGKFLDQLGIDTEYATDGQEAVDVVSSKKCHLVLMDLNMPILNGLDACKKIRDKEDNYFKNIPIIAVTSSFADDIESQMREYGLTDYVPKPINPISIKKVIAKYLPELSQKKSVPMASSKLICECEEEQFDCSKLYEITNGNVEMVSDIIKTIVEILPKEIKLITGAVETKDYTVLKRSAHKIKPNYEYIGLFELASIAERIEESAGKIQSEILNGLILKLSERTMQIVPYLGKCELKQVR